MQAKANKEPEQKVLFVISPIGPNGSEIRRRANQVLEHVIIPAAVECGYTRENVVRADQIPNPGMITSQVVRHIVEANMVVADLTGHNPNVFYELAVRHATRKPVVLLIQMDQVIPFDIAQNRVIHFDPSDWNSPLESRKQLSQQIRFAQENPDEIDTPISTAVNFGALNASGDPIAVTIGNLLKRFEGLQATVSDLASRLHDNSAWLNSLAAATVNPFADALPFDNTAPASAFLPTAAMFRTDTRYPPQAVDSKTVRVSMSKPSTAATKDETD